MADKADKKDIQPQDVQDAESAEDGFEKLLEDASKRYRVYRDFHDSFKLTTPWPLPGYELPPSPERPLVVTSFEQLLNYGKERGNAQL